MKSLDKVLRALDMQPDETVCVMENQVGRDDYCWVHLLPGEENQGLVAYIDFGKGPAPDLEGAESALRRFSGALPSSLQHAVPECLKVVCVDGMTVLLQRTIPGGKSLAAALRVKGTINTRLDTAVKPVLDWLFEVSRHQPHAVPDKDRIEKIGRKVCGEGAVGVDAFNVLAGRLQDSSGGRSAPRFGSVRPEYIHIGNDRICFRIGDRFQLCDPLWSDLFGFYDATVEFLAAENKRCRAETAKWFESRIVAGFETLGMTAQQVGLIRLMANIERYADYYTSRHPDAEARRQWRLRIQEAVQGLE